MKSPRKKVLMILAAAGVLVLAAAVVVFAVIKPFGGRRYGPPPRITVNFPESGGGAVALQKVLVPAAKKDKGFYIYVESLPEQEYSRLLPSRLTDPVNGDLYYVINNSSLRELAEKALIVPLPSAVRKKWKAALPAVFLTLGPGSAEEPFYIPVSWYPWGFYYRKSVFAEAGIKPPATWDDFLAVCEALKGRGIIPVGMTGQVKWPLLAWFDYLDIRLNGADFHARWTALEIPFTDPGIIKVTDILIDLRNRGYLQIETEAPDWEVLPRELLGKKTGMVLCGSFFMDRIPEPQRGDIGWFPFPSFGTSEKVEIISSAGFVLSAVAPNRDNALSLLDYLLETDFQKRLTTEKTGMIPVLPRLVGALEREDLSAGYQRAVGSDRLFEMSERNMDNRMIIPFKAVISNFLTVEEGNTRTILTILEEERRKVLLSGK